MDGQRSREKVLGGLYILLPMCILKDTYTMMTEAQAILRGSGPLASC